MDDRTVVGVPEEEAGTEAGNLLASVACDHDVGKGTEGG